MKRDQIEMGVKLIGRVYMVIAVTNLIALALAVFFASHELLKTMAFTSPLVTVAMFFLGRGISRKIEWIRSISVWLLFTVILLGLPYFIYSGALLKAPIRIGLSVLIHVGVLVFLTRPSTKQVFLMKQEEQVSSVSKANEDSRYNKQ